MSYINQFLKAVGPRTRTKRSKSVRIKLATNTRISLARQPTIAAKVPNSFKVFGFALRTGHEGLDNNYPETDPNCEGQSRMIPRDSNLFNDSKNE